jgi:hypothetical protein
MILRGKNAVLVNSEIRTFSQREARLNKNLINMKLISITTEIQSVLVEEK